MAKRLWVEFERALNEGEQEFVLGTLETILGDAEDCGYDEYDGLHRFSAELVPAVSFEAIREELENRETDLQVTDIYAQGE